MARCELTDGTACPTGFIEGDITFRPTYKFDPQPPNAPKRDKPRAFSDHKDRTPSWTDRVIYRPMPGHEVTQTSYDSAWKVVSSDHDPVFATYDFVAPSIPTAGNYRRFLLVLSGLEVSGLTDPGPSVQITINFPFRECSALTPVSVRAWVPTKHASSTHAPRTLLLRYGYLTASFDIAMALYSHSGRYQEGH
jgi:hypothetical protein